jgi:signal transduction histidine kinase
MDWHRLCAVTRRRLPALGFAPPAELAFVGGIALVNTAGSIVTDPSVSGLETPAPIWTVPLLAAPGLALALRRSYPLVPISVSTAVLAVLSIQTYQVGSIPGTLFLSAYMLGSWTVFSRGVVGLAAPLVLITALTLNGAPFFDTPLALTIPAILLAVWGAGVAARQRRVRDEADRIESHTIAIVHAIEAERVRIARELHDVVSHTLSVVSVHAGVARHLLASQADPASVERSVTTIEEASRAALEDLRRMLGVLRDPDTLSTDLPPAPGVEDIRRLLAMHDVTHGPTTLDLDPAFESLPESLRFTAFRIVQEGLTNVAKHAPGANAVVTVEIDRDRLYIVVDDHGAPPGKTVRFSAAPNGHDGRSGVGLAGIRERVAIFGGTLSAEPAPNRAGFRLVVELPINQGVAVGQVAS